MAPTHTCKTSIKSSGSRYNQTRNRVRGATITPIIKIVHVYAPMLVRTDVANFRALVQKMTGNDTHARHSIKDVNTDCSTHEASANESINKQKLEVKTVSSQASAHREGSYCTSSGGRCLQGGMKEKGTDDISKSKYCNEEEEEEEDVPWMESPKSWERSSCDCSVDSFFAESTSAEDNLYKQQQQHCSAYFATWRQPLEIPGGFESFDYF